jgi:hypothetical protein
MAEPVPIEGDIRVEHGTVPNSKEIFVVWARVKNDHSPLDGYQLTDLKMTLDPADFSTGAPFHLYPEGDDKKIVLKDDDLPVGSEWKQDFTLKADDITNTTETGDAKIKFEGKLDGSLNVIREVTVSITVVKN